MYIRAYHISMALCSNSHARIVANTSKYSQMIRPVSYTPIDHVRLFGVTIAADHSLDTVMSQMYAKYVSFGFGS